ncbi:MAG: pilus assembly protein PilP [Endozoicomonadaceae bacterium]|nr:pilus assembly protein PilP [Endozoicomonadaceae bacterium]
MSQSCYIFTCLLIILNLTGCDNSHYHTDLKNYFHEVEKQSIQPKKKLMHIEQYEPVSYNASHLKDPFKEMHNPDKKIIKKKNDIKPNPDRIKQFLEKFNLTLFTFKGVLQQSDEPLKALVQVNNTVHIVSVGDYLGVNDGQIISITNTAIHVKEIIPINHNNWNEHTQVLSLKKSK